MRYRVYELTFHHACLHLVRKYTSQQLTRTIVQTSQHLTTSARYPPTRTSTTSYGLRGSLTSCYLPWWTTNSRVKRWYPNPPSQQGNGNWAHLRDWDKFRGWVVQLQNVQMPPSTSRRRAQRYPTYPDTMWAHGTWLCEAWILFNSVVFKTTIRKFTPKIRQQTHSSDNARCSGQNWVWKRLHQGWQTLLPAARAVASNPGFYKTK